MSTRGAVAILALMLGCASGNATPDAARSDGALADTRVDALLDVVMDRTPTCEPPLVVCGIGCVNIQTDPTNCGTCGRTCVVPNASAACLSGACGIESCDEGWFDVDDDPLNGCEVENVCIADEPCTTVCGSTGRTACVEGSEPTCTPPAETCDLTDDDCNGACDEGSIAGCRRPIHRANGNGHLYTLNLAEASTAPFSLERENYYFLYTGPHPGAVGFYRCLKGNGKRLYTVNAGCEGVGTMEGVLGFIGSEAVCGSTPLYRVFNAAQGNHFYTTSAPERDNAVTSLGYVDEGTVGHVWTGL